MINARTSTVRTTVWLDIGGVLFHNMVEETPFLCDLAEGWHLPPDYVRERYTAAQESGLEIGHGRLADVWAQMRGRDGDIRDAATAAALYLRSLQPDRMAWAFAHAANEHYALYLTNNEIAEWDQLRELAFPSTAIARGKFSSFQLGVAKPSAQFFRACLERLNLDPEEVVYFDDDQECVAAADALSIEAHIWAGVSDACARLGIHGLSI